MSALTIEEIEALASVLGYAFREGLRSSHDNRQVEMLLYSLNNDEIITQCPCYHDTLEEACQCTWEHYVRSAND